MSRESAVWLDREHAKILMFGPGKEKPEVRKVTAHLLVHHTHRLEGDEKESRKFYHEVAQALVDADLILIMGPGLAKHHLRTHLIEHHPNLSRRVVGVESVDHPTEGQLTAYAARYFDRLLFDTSGISLAQVE